MALGKEIRRLREARNWTLEQLSETSDVDVGTISAIELRDSSRTKYAAQLARALDTTVEALTGGTAVSIQGGQATASIGGIRAEALAAFDRLPVAEQRKALLELRYRADLAELEYSPPPALKKG